MGWLEAKDRMSRLQGLSGEGGGEGGMFRQGGVASG